MVTRVICLFVFVISAWTDWRKQVIYNWVLAGGVAVGVAATLAVESPAGVVLRMMHGAAIASGLLLLYVAGGIGAGDVKLVFTMGFLLLPKESWRILLWGCILAGSHVLWLAVRRGVLREVVLRTVGLLFPAVQRDSPWIPGKRGSDGSQGGKPMGELMVPLGFWISCAGLLVLAKA